MALENIINTQFANKVEKPRDPPPQPIEMAENSSLEILPKEEEKGEQEITILNIYQPLEHNNTGFFKTSNEIPPDTPNSKRLNFDVKVGSASSSHSLSSS